MANQPVSLTKLAQWGDKVPQNSVEFQRSQELEKTSPCSETQNLSPSDNLIFGKWDELALLLWGDACDILFNRYTLAASNQIQVVITMLCNAVVLRPGFAVSTDAASQ
jgi:hypothetical protein